MPDAGDFDHDRSQARRYGDWGRAFAALPLQTPDANGWQRLQARLPAAAHTPRAPRWPLWLATAASLALAVAIPLRLQPDPVQGAASTEVAPLPAAGLPVSPAASRQGNALAEESAPLRTAPPTAAAMGITPAQGVARSKSPVRKAAIPVAQRPIRTLAQPADDTRIAAAESADDLEPLYAQSAQLEDLLVLARDDRVASGPVAALTEELDAQVASIDAALIQADVSSQRRTELWRERVDTLRQLVGVEATQRLLAARGQQYDAALVSID